MNQPLTATIPMLTRFFALSFLVSLTLFADTPIVRMARISTIEGEVSYRRANDDGSSWYDASANTPLGENDQVYAGQGGRAEIQLTGRNIVRLDSDTSFKISQFTTAVTQVNLPVGTAIFRIDSLDRRQFDLVDANDLATNDPLYFEVSTPTVSVTLLKTGEYRISVREDGTTEVIVRSGEAEVYNQELDSLVIKKGRRIIVEGQDISSYQIARLSNKDSFDRWNERRDDELSYQSASLSARYVPQGVPGVYDLDRHGDWWYTSDYGYVWSPRAVATGWAPYRVGSWRWYSDWGWTWISNEPWGWTPYHYGRWAYYRSRWCWVPRGSGVSVGFSWSPALVTFFGWGNGGYNRGYNNGYRQGYRDARYDYVGWVPLAPGERYQNPFRGGTTIVNNTNIYGDGNTVNNGRLDTYRNFTAPGGVTRMEGRRFDSHRVAVVNPNNTTPLQQPVVRSAITARGDSFRPTARPSESLPINPAADPTRRPVTQREVVTRGFTRGGEIITPNPTTGDRRSGGVPTMRSADVQRTPERNPVATDRMSRDSLNSNATNRDATRGTTDSAPVRTYNRGASPEGATDREYRRMERPADRSLERPTPPMRQTEQPANTERITIIPSRPATGSGQDGNNQRDTYRRPMPSEVTPRRNDTERREMPTRRMESPSEPVAPRAMERREMPARRAEPPSAPPAPRQAEPPREPRREERPAPARETRSYERPSQPSQPSAPPPRYEAPRQTERPSAPPNARTMDAPQRGGGGNRRAVDQ